MKSVFLEKNDIHCTLTTFLYCHFSMLWGAEQLGYQSYINWFQGGSVLSYEDKEMFQREPNQYNWYFKQPMLDHPPLTYSARWTWEIPGPWSQYPLMSQPLSVIKDYYKKHLKFNDTTNARGQAIVDKYKIDFSKTIGITWRGTDIYLESLNGNHGRKRMPIETYFPFIDEILEKEPDLRIACTAEEEKILDPLLARYPSAFKIEEFEQVPHESKHNPERYSKRSGYERGLQPALMVWLFSKCKYYIKNRSSVAAVASWLSDGKIISLGHPETLGFYDGGAVFKPVAEIEGKEYPINL